MCLQEKTNENEEESSHNKTADERAPQDASKAQRSASGGTSDVSYFCPPITHYTFFCCLQLTSFIFVIFDAANPSFFSSIYGIQSAGNIHTGPISYSRRSVRSTSKAQNKEGDDAAKKIAEAEAEKNKMEETRKLKQQRTKEAIKNKRAKAQLAKDN